MQTDGPDIWGGVMRISGSVRVETSGDRVLVAIMADGKETDFSLSIPAAENLAEFLVRVVRAAKARHRLSEAT
jgi:hypothetical protein